MPTRKVRILIQFHLTNLLCLRERHADAQIFYLPVESAAYSSHIFPQVPAEEFELSVRHLNLQG